MLEQRLRQLRRCVGGEAQPPVLIGPCEVEHAFIVAAPCAPALDRAGEGLRYLGFNGKAREQPRKRLRALGIERNAPRPLAGIPAAAWQSAQQLTQALVEREAQYGLAVFERGVKRGG